MGESGGPDDDAGADHPTFACPLPAAASTPVGAPGVVPGVTPLDATDTHRVPMAFTAATLNADVVPLARPVTTLDVPVPADGTGVCATAPMEGVTT